MTQDGRPAPLSREAAIVEEAMRALFKAQRTHQLYQANSPSRGTALELARVQLGKAWEVADPLVLNVQKQSLLFNGEPVLAESALAGDGLAWQLYREGIREIRLARGFEQAELETLLEVFAKARTATIDDDDLVTMLWLANLAFFTFRHVEVVLGSGGTGQEGSAEQAEEAAKVDEGLAIVFGTGRATRGRAVPASVDEEVGGFLEAAHPMVMLQPDDDQMLRLDAEEQAYLAAELAREYDEGYRISVLHALLEILEMAGEERGRLDAVAALDELLLEFLGTGQYAAAATLLEEADLALATLDLDATVFEALGQLAGRVSGPGVLRPLLAVLTQAHRAPPGEVLDRLFAELRPEVLPLVAAWLAETPQSPVRARVERVALRLAAEHPEVLAGALVSAEPFERRGALSLAARRPVPVLAEALCEVAGDDDPAVRLGAVSVLAALDGTAGDAVFVEACTDADRGVRMAAYRAVVARRLPQASGLLLAIVQEGRHAPYDFNERVALFEALGAVADAEAVALMDRLLNVRGLLGPKEPPEVRACAARGLGRAGTPEARAALERAGEPKDALVLRAVRLALAGEAGS